MDDLQGRVQSIAEQILALSEQSQQIGEIITTVGDLADQSNLLALNAAIEANRAGEHGKGFAVVAQEIRSLAEQSKAATAQVRTILSDIQRATHAAVMATEQGTKGAEASAGTVEQAGHAIEALADVVQQSAQTAAQIAAAVRQHSVGMEQIAAAMGNIDQATRQSLAASRDTRQAAEHLTQFAQRLDLLVGPYRA
jgi:methyl-accepting chemotaxis protein